MHTTMIARSAIEIVDVLERTKQAEDHHIPTLLEDVRARLDWMGMDLEDVVLAGIYRIGRVSAKIASWAERDYCPGVFLNTANWREEIGKTLEYGAPELDWADTTFLKVLLTQSAVSPSELLRANSILEFQVRAIEEEMRMLKREETAAEANAADDMPPPAQLTLV